MATKNTKKSKSKKAKRKTILVIEVALAAICLVAVGILAYVKTQLNKVQWDDQLSDADMNINDDIDEDTLATMGGYTNIAIFGLDNRSSGNYESGNSDTIMILSINNETNDVKLVSVYRDTILNVKDDTYTKCNAAFSRGGATAAVAMLNSNLDLDISGYVCVDWVALVEVIDDLGGLDLNLTSQEVELLNTYLIDVDQLTGYSTPALSGSGMLHLNGTQALCYARIRKTAGDDFLRTSRQRIVLQAMLEKAKTAGKGTLVGICEDIFDDIATSLSLSQILSLAGDVQNYNIVATTGFPTDLVCETYPSSGDSVIPVTLETNVESLHAFLFEEMDYQASPSVVLISNHIIETSGIDESTEPLPIDQYNDTTGATGTDFKDE